MAKGDKYIGLMRFLKESNKGEYRLTFKEIEKIIGFKLPASANDHSGQWWSNDRYHSQANAWMNAGYLTDTVADTFANEVILFVKDKKA